MISNSETKMEAVKQELPTESFQLDSPLNNTLINSRPFSVRSEEGGFSLSPTTESPEPANPSSDALLFRLAVSARKSTRRFPDSARAHANLGAALFKAGENEQAENELRRALELEPAHYLAGMTLAKLFTQQQKLTEAERLYEEMNAGGHNDPLIPVNLANLALSRGEYAKAIVIIKDSEALPLVARHYILGILRLHEGNNQEAVRELRAAVRLEVRNPQLNNALGVAYAILKEYSKAERCFKAALALAPNDAASIRALAKLYLETKQIEKGIQLLHTYLESQGSDTVAREFLGHAYLLAEKPSMARSQFKMLLANNTAIPKSERSRHHCNIGVSFMRERKYLEAKKQLLISIELDENKSPVPYENYARVLMFGFQDDSKAADVLRIAKRSFPERVAIGMLLSAAYARLYQFTAAITSLVPFYSAEAPSEVFVQLGWLYDAVGNVQNAVQVLRAGFVKYPHDAAVINNLAYTLLSAGEVNEARTVIESLPKNAVKHLELVATQGLLKLYEGNIDAARWLYKRAESMAKKIGDKDSLRRVRQKMHLEFSKYFFRKSDLNEAIRELRASRAEKVKFFSYEKEIEVLNKLIEEKVK
jgi:Flp pilus assembly protein TadD